MISVCHIISDIKLTLITWISYHLFLCSWKVTCREKLWDHVNILFFIKVLPTNTPPSDYFCLNHCSDCGMAIFFFVNTKLLCLWKTDQNSPTINPSVGFLSKVEERNWERGGGDGRDWVLRVFFIFRILEMRRTIWIFRFFLERGKSFSRQRKKTPVMVFVPCWASRGEKSCLEVK